MTELPDAPSPEMTGPPKGTPDEVMELELTLRLPHPVLTLFFRMGEQLNLDSNKLARLAIEEYARNYFDPDLPKPDLGWPAVNEP
ncbi:hypothetical protein [Rhodococcus sp. ARC_M6]|uniref:hypothetical protein n=1 Tax=Rhodococcus sp. ARC_M6 TaxID=2928852 RepID=UPI001FB33DAE|nr:hypothetical protein [Rhodococcus sp. ARC_M6]MCJ0907109.1 hypothetical protein [Rhodococcus sp. ARC_M6]